MKILHITDIHFKLFIFAWISEKQNDYDAICITGDFIDARNPLAENMQADYILNWIKSIKVPIFICSGNHDVISGSYNWLKDLSRGDDSITALGSINIGCAPEDCEDFIKFRNCDILLHHYPPYGSKTSIDKSGGNFGSIFLKNDFSILNCRYILCGHIHQPKNRKVRRKNTLIYNVGGTHTPESICFIEISI